MNLTNELIVTFLKGGVDNVKVDVITYSTSGEATHYNAGSLSSQKEYFSLLSRKQRKANNDYGRLKGTQGAYPVKTNINPREKTNNNINYLDISLVYYQNNIVASVSQYEGFIYVRNWIVDATLDISSDTTGYNKCANATYAWRTTGDPYLLRSRRQFNPTLHKIESDTNTTERSVFVRHNVDYAYHEYGIINEGNLKYYFTSRKPKYSIRPQGLPTYDLVTSGVTVVGSLDQWRNEGYLTFTFAGLTTTNLDLYNLDIKARVRTGDPYFYLSDIMRSISAHHGGLVTMTWNDEKYKEYSDESVSDGWSIDMQAQYYLISDLGFKVDTTGYEDCTYTLVVPTGTPTIGSSDTYTRGSITVNVDNGSLYPSESFLRYANVSESDVSGKIFEITQDQVLDFDKELTTLRGKSLKLISYYDTILGKKSYTKSSDVFCPTDRAYYDISDITLTMSGVRYDGGNIPYTYDILTVDGDNVTKSNLRKTFQSVSDVEISARFRITANEKDVDNYTHDFAAPPDDIYFFAVGKAAMSDSEIRDLILKVKDEYIMGERKDHDRKHFPNVNGNAGDDLVTILESSPATLEAYPIKVNKLEYSSAITSPYDGSFDTDTVTINLTIAHGIWAYFVLIKHLDNGYTIHCLSNTKYFDLPSRHDFEY